jgi:glycosyltransferase involved in cell wall biosynthesis
VRQQSRDAGKREQQQAGRKRLGELAAPQLPLNRRGKRARVEPEIAADGDRDGIPNVIAESMAMGVPVVATRVSAIPELVIDRRTGLLVAPENPEALARSITRMLTDMELRRRIIPAARNRVRQVFDNRALIKNVAKVHQEGIAGL